MSDFILHTVEVSLSFSGVLAVNRASLGLREGSIHALIGPNGAGKTTLFNLISGYYKPTTGQVHYKGENITGLEPFEICQKGIVRTFQVASIYPMLTVFENVQIALFCNQRRMFHFFAKAKKICCDEVNEILRQVGLSERKDMLAGNLSQGDRKRLELGIVLANRPKVLLLDEPTAGMSPDETRQIMELIQKIQEEEELSILFTEHDMAFVFGIAERITVLYQGGILLEGSPEEVRGHKEVQRIYLNED